MSHERPGDIHLPLRQRKKLQTKRRVQSVALSLLSRFDYPELTVSQIAKTAEVSESTIYRHFQTKDGIFLWDEYDESVFGEFAGLLGDHHPLEAMSRAIDDVMASRFDLDRDTALRQLALIERVPQLRQAMLGRLDEFRRLLIHEIVEAGWQPVDAAVLAGSLVGALIGVMELWTSGGGTESLPALLQRATKTLAQGFDESNLR